jgi:hypothetical protein
VNRCTKQKWGRRVGQYGGVSNFSAIDHIVIAGPNLEQLVSMWREATGIETSPGGAHTGRGTRNELVGIDATTYIELIGPDQDQPDPPAPRAFGIDALGGPSLVTFAIGVRDLDVACAAVRSAGIDPGVIAPMERLRPDGVRLAWRLSVPTDLELGGIMPFLIEWGESTPHPAADLAHDVEIATLSLAHPRAEQIHAAIQAATGWSMPIEVGESRINATLKSETAELSL